MTVDGLGCLIWWELGFQPEIVDLRIIKPAQLQGRHTHFLLCKVWEAVLLARITRILGPSNAISSTQGGFRAHTSTMEMVTALHSHVAARRASGLPTFICFRRLSDGISLYF